MLLYQSIYIILVYQYTCNIVLISLFMYFLHYHDTVHMLELLKARFAFRKRNNWVTIACDWIIYLPIRDPFSRSLSLNSVVFWTHLFL